MDPPLYSGITWRVKKVGSTWWKCTKASDDVTIGWESYGWCLLSWHLLCMLSTSFSAYFVGRERYTSLIRRESCFRVNARLPASLLITTLHTFSTGFASEDCEGQSKVVMPFSAFQNVQRWLRCLGSLSSWRIQSLLLAPNIFSVHFRRPCS